MSLMPLREVVSPFFFFIHFFQEKSPSWLQKKKNEQVFLFWKMSFFSTSLTAHRCQSEPHRSAFFVHFRQPRNRIKRGANVFLKSYCRVRRVECRRTWPPSFFCRNAQLVAILWIMNASCTDTNVLLSFSSSIFHEKGELDPASWRSHPDSGSIYVRVRPEVHYRQVPADRGLDIADQIHAGQRCRIVWVSSVDSTAS